MLKGVNASAVIVENAGDLDGLSKSVAVAAEAAARHAWKIRRALHEHDGTAHAAVAAEESSVTRAHLQGLAESWLGRRRFPTGLISQISLELRVDKAQLLGYANHAAMFWKDETALTPNAVNRMLAPMVPPAVANAKAEGGGNPENHRCTGQGRRREQLQLAPWDWDFYAEQVRSQYS